MKSKLLISTGFLLTVFLAVQGQQKWKASIEARKVFLENKSQFNERDQLRNSEILFATDEGPVMIYFTKSGLTYRFDKTEREDEEVGRGQEDKRSFAEREEEEHRMKVKTDVIHMQWENANPSVKVIPSGEESFYYSYSVGQRGINHIKAYKKLLYKELYPNIDVEYIYHPKEGIEYSFILHPGADISQVKMKYTGTDKVSIDADGKVHLSTLFGDIIEHAPITAYADADNASIPSKFIRNGKTISFELGAYDASRTVVVDPWTVLPPNLGMYNINSVFYMKSDTAGNAYIYGGDSPYRLQKYDTAGALVWTYTTPWNSASVWFGALAVDFNGNAYITNGSGATLAKIDSSGAFIWSRTSGNTFSDVIEFWAMDFNCSQTELYIGGTSAVPFSFDFRGTIFKMNMNDGSIISRLSVVHPTLSINNEVRSLCWAADNNLHYLSLDSVGSLSRAFSINYGRKSTYAFPYYLPYSNSAGGQGQSNIRGNDQFLYTSDGATLHKRSLSTGAILASAAIPGGSANNNSGLALDSCGNIYVGAQTRVVKFDDSLHVVTYAATPGPVYDVSVGINGDVLACGQGFAMAVNLNACSQYKPDCCRATAFITSNKPLICSGDSTHLCAQPGMASYLWNTGQTTQCIDTKLAGNYYATVSDGMGCTATSNRISLTVFPLPPVSISVNGDTLTAYNSDNYQWFMNGAAIPGATSNQYIAHQTGDYAVAVADSNGCVATSTVISIVTAVDNLSADEHLSVYPNPLEFGRWSLLASEAFIGSRIEVFDNNGRLLYQSEIRNGKTEIALDIPHGVYMMRVASDTKNVSLKLIKL